MSQVQGILESIENGSAISTALALGAAMTEPVVIGDNQYVVLPEGYSVHDLERLLPTPSRKRASVIVRDVDSFVAYFKRHQLGSTLYGRIDPPRFLAVLDDHRQDEPGWREHTVAYNCPLTVEWQTWLGKNKAWMKQAEFAQFVEDNLPDIVDPPGGDMLLISRTLEAKKSINFASGIRLANGEQELTYEEKIDGTAGKGKLKIPEEFKLGVAPLEKGDRYELTARLRYRIDSGTLMLSYDLLRAHKVLEAAVMGVWTKIAAETGCLILNGDPFKA